MIAMGKSQCGSKLFRHYDRRDILPALDDVLLFSNEDRKGGKD